MRLIKLQIRSNVALDKAKSEEEMVAIVDEFNHFHNMIQALLKDLSKKARNDISKN